MADYGDAEDEVNDYYLTVLSDRRDYVAERDDYRGVVFEIASLLRFSNY